MAATWELILHHAYRGRPGIVFDESPGQGSHASVIAIPDDRFLADGAEQGSGAVVLRPFSRIVVAPRRGWDQLGGVRAEVVCRVDSEHGGGFLIDGFTFSFGVTRTFISAGFETSHGEKSYRAPLDLADQWVTVGFVYDGFATIAFTLNGNVISAEPAAPREPIMPTTQVNIGNEIRDDHAFDGLIDDVKVWRLNPYRVNDGFTSRPMDPGVRECWVDYHDQLGQAMRDLAARDPECPLRIFDLVDAATRSALDDAVATPASRDVLVDAAGFYRRQWETGDLAGAGATLRQLYSDLTDQGWDGEHNPAYQALVSDPCWQELISRLRPIDCDQQFDDLIARLAQGLTR